MPFRKAPLRSVKCVYCSIFCCLNLLLFIVAAADPSTMKGSSQPSAVISSQIVELTKKKKKQIRQRRNLLWNAKKKKNCWPLIAQLSLRALLPFGVVNVHVGQFLIPRCRFQTAPGGNRKGWWRRLLHPHRTRLLPTAGTRLRPRTWQKNLRTRYSEDKLESQSAGLVEKIWLRCSAEGAFFPTRWKKMKTNLVWWRQECVPLVPPTHKRTPREGRGVQTKFLCGWVVQHGLHTLKLCAL